MIRLENVSKYYRTANSVGLGLRKINLRFKKGEFVVITGESGSGKSTLLNVISGLDTYEEGEMYLFGDETSHFSIDEWERYRAENIGFVFQNYNIIESYTVLQNILLALEIQNYPKENRRKRALELIKKVGLEKRIHHKSGKLSGGEKQRTVIARALAKDARVIVCDEPTGNLDSKSSKAIISLIEELSKDKLVILVTHNYEEVRHVATRRIRLRDGEIIEDREIKKVDQNNDFEKQVEMSKVSFLTLLNSSIRTLFATPKRLLFVLSLQIVITGIFIFIYAYLMFSSDILVGELASDNDSSHKLEIVRRDEMAITDLSEFENNELISSVVDLETTYYVYSAIGKIEGDDPAGSYSLGQINMNDASVLNVQDLSEGTLPNENEIVINKLALDLYDLEVGDQVSLLKIYTQFTKSAGDIYTISGTTIRGNDKSVYFNNAVFSNKNLALDGLISSAGKRLNYTYLKEDPINPEGDPILNYSTMSNGKFIFDDSLGDWEIIIPSHLWPDPMEVTVTGFEIIIGPYNGVSYTFDVDRSKVLKTSETATNIYLSTEYQDVLTNHFFGDDFTPNKVILNVHDITDGRELSEMLNHQVYRVYYDVVALNTRDEILTQNQFTMVSYIIVFIVGSLLYMILGVVLRNINYSKRKDFAIFRSIGANRSFLAKQVIIENALSGVIAFGLVVVVLTLLGKYNYMVSESMRHVEFLQYSILFVISILLSIQLSRGFNKKIFNFSVISALNESVEVR